MFVLGCYFVFVVSVLGLLVGFCFDFYSCGQQCTESDDTTLRFCKNPKCPGY